MGQLIRFVTRNRYLLYPEEERDFSLPDAWVDMLNNPDQCRPSSSSSSTRQGDASGAATPAGEFKKRQDSEQPDASHDEKQESSGDGSSPQGEQHTGNDSHDSMDTEQQGMQLQRTGTSVSSRNFTGERLEEERIHSMERTQSLPIVPKRTRDGLILVDWYYSDDPANPHNWSNAKRLAVSSIICLYTFVVYTTSAIYVSSEPGVQKAFGVSSIVSTLGLALYVLGYGVGPLIFSPLSEIPVIGRNPVYVATMFLFVILSIPTAFAQNFAGLMVLRFLTGFFGSPCLASGGASLGDMYSLLSLPYAMMAWVAAAYCGRECFIPPHSSPPSSPARSIPAC